MCGPEPGAEHKQFKVTWTQASTAGSQTGETGETGNGLGHQMLQRHVLS